MKELTEKQIAEVREKISNYEGLDIFGLISSEKGYDEILSQAETQEEKTAAEELAKGMSDHFSKQIQEIAKSLQDPENIKKFFELLNKRSNPHGDR